jgi:hypothetical protein
MNKLPCNKCQHFDQQYRKEGAYRRELWYGHCTLASVYPAKERDGQVFPEGAKRVESETELAQPKIVRGLTVLQGCASAMKRG